MYSAQLSTNYSEDVRCVLKYFSMLCHPTSLLPVSAVVMLSHSSRLDGYNYYNMIIRIYSLDYMVNSGETMCSRIICERYASSSHICPSVSAIQVVGGKLDGISQATRPESLQETHVSGLYILKF